MLDGRYSVFGIAMIELGLRLGLRIVALRF